MAKQLKRKLDDVDAKHAEIARRYAWQAQRKRKGEKPDKARLITLIRLRELERLFHHRYGRMLPDDDAGRDDLAVAAHHVAHLGGDVIGHIVAWARVWAPWMPEAEANSLARQVAADPLRFTADALAWRLRMSASERCELGITTIGAFDMSKAERAEERKRKDREAKRAKRAQNSTGRPRGRPRKAASKNSSAAVREPVAVDGFSERVVTPTKNAAIKPPAVASGTLLRIKSMIEEVDGAAVVGRPNQRFKTRVPTAMRLDKEMLGYAKEAGFEAAQIRDMFETFKLWNLAMRSYSADWRDVWFNWVDREVRHAYERYEREHQAYWRAYFDRRASA